MHEFFLSYQGPLSTTGHARAKFALRRHFDRQLRRFQHYLEEDQAPPEFSFRPENRMIVGEFVFNPLVTKSSKKVIVLDFLVLSDCDANCSSSFPTGDLDNYAKTILDGLRMAQTMNEIRDHTPHENEHELLVLMEDDQIIRNLNISHHKNLFPNLEDSKLKCREVFVLIKVKIFDKYCF